MMALLALLLVPFGIWGERIDAGLAQLLAAPSSAAVVAAVVFVSLAADVVLPLPSSLLSAAAVTWLGPLTGGAVVWAGMTTGHMVGYAIGRRLGTRAVAVVAGAETAARLTGLGRSFGMAALVALTRAVPVLSEACAVVAGTSGMAAGRFLAVAAAANFGVALVYGAVIFATGDAAPFLGVFAASLVVPALGYLVFWHSTRRAG